MPQREMAPQMELPTVGRTAQLMAQLLELRKAQQTVMVRPTAQQMVPLLVSLARPKALDGAADGTWLV